MNDIMNNFIVYDVLDEHKQQFYDCLEDINVVATEVVFGDYGHAVMIEIDEVVDNINYWMEQETTDFTAIDVTVLTHQQKIEILKLAANSQSWQGEKSFVHHYDDVEDENLADSVNRITKMKE